jgi:hypothetical protein
LKRKTRKTLRLTGDHAAHALHILIADGKLAAKDVASALKRREGLIRDLRQRLVALEQGAVSTIERTGKKVARKVAPKGRRAMSPARRAALKLHGRYLGTVRSLSKTNRSKVKSIREKKGVRAGIAAARKMANSANPGAKPQRVRAQATQPDYQGAQQRKVTAYQRREGPRPDKHGGSGAGREQGGSGAARERG